MTAYLKMQLPTAPGISEIHLIPLETGSVHVTVPQCMCEPILMACAVHGHEWVHNDRIGQLLKTFPYVTSIQEN